MERAVGHVLFLILAQLWRQAKASEILSTTRSQFSSCVGPLGGDTHTHVHAHAPAHTRAPTQTHACTHTHTHTHTH